jgi:double stranded RNA-specific editase B
MAFLTEMEPVRAADDQQTDQEVLAYADHIESLIKDKFSNLTNNLTSSYARRKVLAGIVMSVDDNKQNDIVISVTTGTKCISGEYLSNSGSAINDCHAEILARRCLRRFFFKQIQQFFQDPARSIFTSNASGARLAVKPEIKFHLYISSAPCGDARVFAPHEAQNPEADEENQFGYEDRHPNRLARGVLRTKIESGEGTIPVKFSDSCIQTWDGIVAGDRLLTMSCSDKVARMNVLGVQGKFLEEL